MSVFLTNLLLTTVICSILILAILFVTPVLNKYTRKWRYIAFVLISVKLLFPLPVFTSEYALTIPIVGQNEVAGELQQDQDEPRIENTLQEERKNVYYYGDYYYVSDVNEVLDKKDFGSRIIERFEKSENNNQRFSDRSAAVSATSNSNITENNTRWDFSIANVIFFVWLTGVIFAVSYYALLYRYHRRNLKRWSREMEDENILWLLEEEKSRLHIRKEIKIFQCHRISTPMIVGVWNSMILLPNMEYGEDELHYILRHELVHFKHKDIYTKLFFIFIKCMYWFNPIMEIMLKNIHDDMEILCDDTVVKELSKEQRIRYNQTILNIAKYQLEGKVMKSSLFSLGFLPWKNELKERMANVMNAGSKKRGYSVLAVVIALLLIGNSMVCCKDITGAEPPLNKAVYSKGQEAVNVDLQKRETEKADVVEQKNDKLEMQKNDSSQKENRGQISFGNYNLERIMGKMPVTKSYWFQCVFSVAAYEEQKYGYFYRDEAQYYWKCIQLMVKACHNSGYLLDRSVTENFVFDYYYSRENIVGYKVDAEVVDEIGKVFLGKTLEPETIPEQSVIDYDKNEGVYYILFDNSQEYSGYGEIWNKNSDGTFLLSGSLCCSKFDFGFKTHDYEVAAADNPDSKLCGFSIIDINVKNIY